MNSVQAAVQSVLPSNRKATSGGWVSFNAPCCHHRGESPDKRKRGGILFTPEGFAYSCFNCNFKAGWSLGKSLTTNTKDLLKWLGLPESEINKLVLETIKSKSNVPTKTGHMSFELHDVALPDDCLSVSKWNMEGCDDPDFIKIKDYITGRGLRLCDYNWYWSSAPGYRDRVIIPFYYRGAVVGWTGRKITDGVPKYLTNSQNGYVFNLDSQLNERSFVIVVEGQFDAIAIGGVAIMSNKPNEVQCARINALAREIIVVPDRDKAGAVLLESALENGWSMSSPPWEEDVKDVADAVKKYGKVYTLATIVHYKETNKLKIELAKKKLEKLNGP